MSYPTEINNVIPTLHDRNHLYGSSNAPVLLIESSDATSSCGRADYLAQLANEWCNP